MPGTVPITHGISMDGISQEITKMVLSFRLVTDHQDELIFEVQGVEGTCPKSQRGSAELEI